MPQEIRIQDIADILIMTTLLYQLYLWFFKTRAMQVMLGLGVVTLIYFATRFFGLYMTSWILQELGTVLIVLLIVVFQSEIRQTLYKFSLLRHQFAGGKKQQEERFQEVVETLFLFAERRIGALLVFKRNESLDDLMLNGVRLDSEINPQLLESIFSDGTPLHDGAALIENGRLALAACHLPLSVNSDLPQFLGTRHRAALGLSERTDAVVAVVSEERGQVSLAVNGELKPYDSTVELLAALNDLFATPGQNGDKGFWSMLGSNLLPKVAILAVVIVFWTLVSSRQGQIVTVSAPVRMHGLPANLVLVRSTPETVDVQLRSYSMLTPLPSKLDIAADVDVSAVQEGAASVRIKNSDFKLPAGMSVNAATPATIKIVTDRKERKKVPVRVALSGGSAQGLQTLRAVVEPDSVEIEGPSSQLERIDFVSTDPVEPSRFSRGRMYRINLQSQPRNVTLLWDEPVVVRFVPKLKMH